MDTLADLLGAAPTPEEPAKPAPTTRSARTLAREILTSQEYRQTLFDRLKLGILPPAIEVAIWHYAYGKPVEHVKFEEVAPPLEAQTEEQLQAKLDICEKLVQKIRRAKAVKDYTSDSTSGDSVH